MYLEHGSADATDVIVLAHGAGAGMDTPFLDFFADGLAASGRRVVRFEFPYMAERRAGGRRRPPDPPQRLIAAWRAVIAAVGPGRRLVLGGKSLGGRIASMIADEAGARALVCLGYPFHPPGRPERLRTAHLAALRTPALVVQGTRDPFGDRDEVEGWALSPTIRLRWIEDGDHDFVPRAASGRTREQNWSEALQAVEAFVAALPTAG